MSTTYGEVSAGSCLLAAGFQTNILLKSLGLKIPLTTPLVSVVQTVSLPPVLIPVIGVANADLAIRQQLDGTIIFASGAEHLKAELYEEDGLPVVSPPM